MIKKTIRANNGLIKKYKNLFLKQEIAYLTDFQHESSNFYALPKIDKSKIVSKAIQEQLSECISCFLPKYLKLRPKVPGPKCLTKRLSDFVDIVLKLLLYKFKRYVKDGFGYLKKFKRNLTKNSDLVVFYVVRFYRNYHLN